MIVSVVGVRCIMDRCVPFFLMLGVEVNAQLFACKKRSSFVRKMMDEQLTVVLLFVHHGDQLLCSLTVEPRNAQHCTRDMLDSMSSKDTHGKDRFSVPYAHQLLLYVLTDS
jgi:hypothetical protein